MLNIFSSILYVWNHFRFPHYLKSWRLNMSLKLFFYRNRPKIWGVLYNPMMPMLQILLSVASPMWSHIKILLSFQASEASFFLGTMSFIPIHFSGIFSIIFSICNSSTRIQMTISMPEKLEELSTTYHHSVSHPSFHFHLFFYQTLNMDLYIPFL